MRTLDRIDGNFVIKKDNGMFDIEDAECLRDINKSTHKVLHINNIDRLEDGFFERNKFTIVIAKYCNKDILAHIPDYMETVFIESDKKTLFNVKTRCLDNSLYKKIKLVNTKLSAVNYYKNTELIIKNYPERFLNVLSKKVKITDSDLTVFNTAASNITFKKMTKLPETYYNNSLIVSSNSIETKDDKCDFVEFISCDNTIKYFTANIKKIKLSGYLFPDFNIDLDALDIKNCEYNIAGDTPFRLVQSNLSIRNKLYYFLNGEILKYDVNDLIGG